MWATFLHRGLCDTPRHERKLMMTEDSFFQYRKNELCCESARVREIARAAGTPVYIYSSRHIATRFARFERALGKYPQLVCYSVKANSNLSILKRLAARNAGFDIVSGGELFRVLKAGGKANR